jgi:hypothetical protein
MLRFIDGWTVARVQSMIAMGFWVDKNAPT